MTAMMQSDAQVEGKRAGILDLILRTWTMLGFACAAATVMLLAFGVLGTWGIYLGLVAVLGGPTGFFVLARRGSPVRVLSLLLPFIGMMAGAAGLLVSSWTIFELALHR